jgi:ankyrin repeat protein
MRDSAGDFLRDLRQVSQGAFKGAFHGRFLGELACALLICIASPAFAGPPPANETLFIAIDENSTARVQTLLASGADPNGRDDRGEPAIIYALHTGKPDVAEILLKAKGIDLEAENQYGQTVLMVAAYQGRMAMVQALLDADVEVNHKGWTALHFAASSGQVEVVRVLLEHSAYIDAESPSHTTPLMMAARVKDRPTCVLLIQEGADPTPINAPTGAARIRNCSDPRHWLIRRGPDRSPPLAATWGAPRRSSPRQYRPLPLRPADRARDRSN